MTVDLFALIEIFVDNTKLNIIAYKFEKFLMTCKKHNIYM